MIAWGRIVVATAGLAMLLLAIGAGMLAFFAGALWVWTGAASFRDTALRGLVGVGLAGLGGLALAWLEERLCL